MRAAAWEEEDKTWGQKFYLAIGHAAQWATQRIDGIQLGLDGLGLIPGVGIVFDGINVGISVVRGNWGDAGVNVVAMVPIIGQGTKGGKLLAKFSGPLKAVFVKVKKGFGFADEAARGGLSILNPHFTPKPTTLGKVGEYFAGINGDKTKIFINGRGRIPDGLNRTILTEVKNVKTQSFTRQLRDFDDFSKKEGLTFELFVRPGTELSGPLREAIRNEEIILKFIREIL